MNTITVSQEAWAKIHEKLEASASKTVIIGINETGCNGYSYTFTTSKELPLQNYIQEQDHFVTVDQAALPFIQGSTLEWSGDDIFSKHFIFTNPNSTGECGCGESFSI